MPASNINEPRGSQVKVPRKGTRAGAGKQCPSGIPASNVIELRSSQVNVSKERFPRLQSFPRKVPIGCQVKVPRRHMPASNVNKAHLIRKARSFSFQEYIVMVPGVFNQDIRAM